MKRLISAVLVLTLFVTLISGCGEKNKESERILYNKADWDKLVELGDYKKIPVDTKSKTLEEMYQDVLDADVENNQFFTYEELTKGKIENGDIANIDFTGKKDGVPFEGGSDKGYDLTIGSGQFIPGFEEGLVGVEIGATVDLDLKFPENYSSAELAGKDVVFTVKVNKAQRRANETPDKYYSKLSFKSVGDYYKDAKKRSIQNYLVDTVVANSKIKEYPKTEIDFIYSTTKNIIEKNLASQYQMDFAGYLSAIGETEENYKKTVIKEQIKPSMELQMVLYAILDKEELTFTKDDVNKKVNEEVKKINNESVTAETVKEYYGEYYFEQEVVTEKVMEILYKSAKID